MKAAFEILGLPTWHWVTMSENPSDMAFWIEAMESKFDPGSLDSPLPLDRSTFDKLLGHWSACTDQPAALFPEELVKAYPEAKIVLCERDVDRWYESYSRTVVNGTANPFTPIAGLIDPGYLGRMAHMQEIICKHYFHVPGERVKWLMIQKPFIETWRANAKASYLKHNELVKRATPADRLLLFKLEEGWEPLCKFLGKPIPDVPFPRVNETAAVQEKINLTIAESFRRSSVRFARRAVPVAVAAAGVWVWWTWYR